jgi:hypothetical protein
MAARRKKKAKRVTNNSGKTGFIVVARDWDGETWNLNGTDIHKTLKGAQDCCGDTGEDAGVIEVTLVAQYFNSVAMTSGDVKIKLS